MLADWSSIWAGYLIVWGAIVFYGITLVLRLKRSSRVLDERPTPKDRNALE